MSMTSGLSGLSGLLHLILEVELNSSEFRVASAPPGAIFSDDSEVTIIISAVTDLSGIEYS